MKVRPSSRSVCASLTAVAATPCSLAKARASTLEAGDIVLALKVSMMST